MCYEDDAASVGGRQVYEGHTTLFQDTNLIGKSLDLFGIGNLGHNSIK